MARIRSLHPGFWTDEATLALSESNPYALLALAGIWGEADDHGAFDWKPASLKARILGASNVDFRALMDALVEHNCIKKVLLDGREVGLVRNFLVWQSPRKPTYRHAVTDEMLKYLGFGRRKAPQDDETNSNESGTGGDTEAAPTEPIAEVVTHPPGKVNAEGEGEGEGIGKGEGNRVLTHPRPRDEADTAIAMWNRMAEKLKIPKVIPKISDVRRRKIIARLETELGGLEGWDEMLKKIADSPLLRGETKDWTATLDWVLEPRNLTKIMEGNYARRPDTHRKGSFAGATESFTLGLAESGNGDREGGQG